MSKPVVMKRLDDYGGIPYLFFDEDTRVMFVAGKGESAISYFQFSNAGNYLDYLGVFKGKEP